MRHSYSTSAVRHFFGKPGGLCMPCLAVFIVSSIFSVGVARAEYIGSDLVVVTMSDDQGRSASWGIANPFDVPDGISVPDSIHETSDEQIPLMDDGEVLGWVDSLSVWLEGDPVASINFNLTAGGSDVTVTVSSATVAFPALTNPPASAEAEITLTDNGGGAATIETVGANSGLFQAIYNSTLEYAELLGDSSVGGGSVTFSEDTSGPVAGSVSSIKAQFAFQLSAGDSASGTGIFTVVPEPSTLAIVFCASLAAITTRRRR